MLPLFPLFLFLEDRACIVLILKRRRRVLLARLPQSGIGQKRIAGLKTCD
jgi:hypothetical protein